MNEVIKVLCERRSIRNYKEEQIPLNILNEILKCGTYAPSGMGKQSAVIVVIRNKKTIAGIEKINKSFINNNENFHPFYGAPTLLVVLADKNINTYIEDGSAVIINILNAAYSLGVNSCWIHRARETFATKYGKELLKKWGLNENYVGIGNVVLGYSNIEMPKPSKRKENYIIFDKKE